MWPFTRKKDRTADDCWREGSRLLSLGKNAQALAVLKQAAEKEPSRLDGRLNLGVACYMMKQFEEAIPHFKYVLAIDNDHLMALLNLGACYDGMGDYDKSIECLEKVCSSRPDFPDAHFNLAVAYMKKKDIDKAEEALKTELRIRPENQLARNALNEIYVKYPRAAPPKQRL